MMMCLVDCCDFANAKSLDDGVADFELVLESKVVDFKI